MSDDEVVAYDVPPRYLFFLPFSLARAQNDLCAHTLLATSSNRCFLVILVVLLSAYYRCVLPSHPNSSPFSAAYIGFSFLVCRDFYCCCRFLLKEQILYLTCFLFCNSYCTWLHLFRICLCVCVSVCVCVFVYFCNYMYIHMCVCVFNCAVKWAKQMPLRKLIKNSLVGIF